MYYTVSVQFLSTVPFLRKLIAFDLLYPTPEYSVYKQVHTLTRRVIEFLSAKCLVFQREGYKRQRDQKCWTRDQKAKQLWDQTNWHPIGEAKLHYDESVPVQAQCDVTRTGRTEQLWGECQCWFWRITFNDGNQWSGSYPEYVNKWTEF